MVHLARGEADGFSKTRLSTETRKNGFGRRIAAMLVLVVVVTASLPALHASPAESTRVGGPDAMRGKQVFAECCMACHNKLKKVGPSLADDTAYFVRAGVPGTAMGMLLRHPVRVRPEGSRMPSYTPEEVSDADLDDVGLYLASFTAEPKVPPTLGSAERGAGLYAGHCAACHGAKGEGVGQMLPVAIFAGQLKQGNTPPNVMLGFVMLAARSGSVPKMPTFPEERLSDKDLADIAACIWAMPMPVPMPN